MGLGQSKVTHQMTRQRLKEFCRSTRSMLMKNNLWGNEMRVKEEEEVSGSCHGGAGQADGVAEFDDGQCKKPCVLPRTEGTFSYHSRRAQAAPRTSPSFTERGQRRGTWQHSDAQQSRSSHMSGCAAKQVLGKLTQTIFNGFKPSL